MLLLIVPAVVLTASLFFKAAAGPYWLVFNFDPAYQYLVNGVYLIKGFVPNHTDHPGTPLQILCCLVDRLLNMGQSNEQAAMHVLKSPEVYLQAVFILLTLFIFLTTLGLGFYVFRKTRDIRAGILTQLPVLTFLLIKSWETPEPVLPVVVNVSPEPMLIGVVNLFNLCFLMYFFAETPARRFVLSLVWGAVCGFGAAVKLTFVPIMAVPLLVLSWKEKGAFILAAAGSFVLWTLPIISKYHIIWAWASGIATHGSGFEEPSGREKITMYWNCWKSILVGQWACVGFLLAAGILVVWRLAAGNRSKAVFFLGALAVGVGAQFFAVTQHPGAHYLLPGLGLLSAMLFLFYQELPFTQDTRRKAAAVLIGLVIVISAWQAYAYRLKLSGMTHDIMSFRSHVMAEYPQAIFVDYYRSSDPQAALFFGDGWNLLPHLGQELAALYPDRFYYNLWAHGILNFNGRVWADDLLRTGRPVFFRGDGNTDFSQYPYGLKLLEKGRAENIQLLTASTEKEANIYLAGAVHFIQAKDDADAWGCVLKAKQLHYQPDSTVEELTNALKRLHGGP